MDSLDGGREGGPGREQARAPHATPAIGRRWTWQQTEAIRDKTRAGPSKVTSRSLPRTGAPSPASAGRSLQGSEPE